MGFFGALDGFPTFQKRVVRLLWDLTGDEEHVVSGPLGLRHLEAWVSGFRGLGFGV